MSNPQNWLILAPIILLAITIHECAHAWMADRLGDPTARELGRITFNPMAHLDPLGALCFIFVGFGWGKPVPVNPYNLRSPLRDNMLISAAGPISNLIAAAVFGLVVRLIGFPTGGPTLVGILQMFAFQGVVINVVLAVFNLIPVHPLDGSHVLAGLLPRSAAAGYESFSAYGPTILLLIILSGPLLGYSVLNRVIGPPINFLTFLFAGHPTLQY